MSKRNRKPSSPVGVHVFDPQAFAPAPKGVDWLTLLGFQLGDEIVIFPIGMTGQVLQGELIDIALHPDGSGPVVVTIRNAAERPNVSIPWTSIMMITKAEGPKVEVPQPAEMSLSDIVEFAESQGIDIPDEVRAQVTEESLVGMVGTFDDEDEYGSIVDHDGEWQPVPGSGWSPASKLRKF